MMDATPLKPASAPGKMSPRWNSTAAPGPVNVITPTLGGAPCGLPPWPFALARAGPGAATAIAAAKATITRALDWERTRLAIWVVLYIQVSSGAFLRRRGQNPKHGRRSIDPSARSPLTVPGFESFERPRPGAVARPALQLIESWRSCPSGSPSGPG